MLQLMEKVFKDKVKSAAWQEMLRAVEPTYGRRVSGDPQAIQQTLVELKPVADIAL